MSTRPIPISGDTRAILSAFTPEPVSLAALTASGVAIEWHEGIAIVQEASRLILESSPSGSAGELSPANVRIDLSGTVFVPRGGIQDGPSAVSQLGALLRDLLPDTLPVPLRLAISQAMSSPPHYTSLRSFSEALSYFERPDRTAVIRAVYERWESNASGRPATQSRYERPSQAQPAIQEPARQEPQARTAATVTHRWMIVTAGIALALTLGGVLAVWAPRSNTQRVEGRTESSAPSSGQPADSGADESTVRAVALPDTTTTAPVASSAATAAPRAEARTAAPIQPAPLESGRLVSPAAALPVRPFSSANDAPVTLEAPRQAPHQPNPVASQRAPSITLVELAADSRIYSAVDTDVAAPVAAYPQSPTVATVLHDDEMLTFDLVIDESGKVESVKLRRAPSSIRSALMLTMSMSVAKAWRFQPATRHGRSVKYRQSISVPAPQ